MNSNRIARQRTIERWQAVQNRYRELSNMTVEGMRLRFEDITDRIAKEFFLAKPTVLKILKVDIDEKQKES